MLRHLIQQTCRLSLNQTSCVKQIPTRETCVFRRMYEPIQGTMKKKRGLRRRHYVYAMVECKTSKPAGNMHLLLKEDVEGVGRKGDVVDIPKRQARNLLLVRRDAVAYPTEENVNAIKKEIEGIERPPRSIWAEKTIKHLEGLHLYIPMNEDVEWTLNKSHVRIAFRKNGIELSEDCLELPAEPITTEGSININVTVNGLDTVPVDAQVFYYKKELAHTYPGRKIT